MPDATKGTLTLGNRRSDIEQLCEVIDSLGRVEFVVFFGFASIGRVQSRGMLVVGSVSQGELDKSLVSCDMEQLVPANRLVMTAWQFWQRCVSGDRYVHEVIRHPERQVYPRSASALVESASVVGPILAVAKSTADVAQRAGIRSRGQEVMLASTGDGGLRED